jgi:hypothetical protein
MLSEAASLRVVYVGSVSFFIRFDGASGRQQQTMKKFVPRAHEREEVDIPARLIIVGKNLAVIRCRIIDRSEAGIKIVMAHAWDLPTKLLILANDNSAVYECELRWQLGDEAGLMFVGACSSSLRQELVAKLNNGENFEPVAEGADWLTDA